MIYGFTGIHKGYDPDLHDSVLRAYIEGLSEADGFVTGAAYGVDTSACKIAYELYPERHHVIIVPARWHNESLVEEMSLLPHVRILRMPEGTTYRDRNEAMVELADRMVAFPLNKLEVPGSGTWMTANIAKRANKLYDVVILCA